MSTGGGHESIDLSAKKVRIAVRAAAKGRSLPGSAAQKSKYSAVWQMTIELSLLQGLSVLTLVFVVYTLYRGQGENEARALTYITLIISNLALILANRSWSRTILERAIPLELLC
jgi:hypothetical protein